MKTLIKQNRGITLVELIIYMGLFAVLIVVITDILVATLNVQLGTSATSSVTQDGRFIYTRFIYDINRATSISVPANLGDTGNSLQFSANGITYTYALNGNDLIITDDSGNNILNSFDTGISGLTFTRIGNIGGKPTIRLNFVINSKNTGSGQQEIKTFQTTAGLR